MTIKVEIGRQQDEHLFQRSWKMGKCYGPRQFPDRFHGSNKDARYEDDNIYIDVCCLIPGDYVLECENAIGPYGWGNGYIEIMGQRYCDDFYGFRAFRNIKVEGNVKITFDLLIGCYVKILF